MPRTELAAAAMALLAMLAGCAAPPAPPREPLPATPPPALDLPVAAPVEPPPPAPVPAPAPKQWNPDGPHIFWFGIGAAYSDEIADLDPSLTGIPPEDLGEFDDWGFAMDFGYQGRVADFEWSSLWLGGEFGFASFANDRDFDITFPSGEVEEGTFTADLFYIAPTVALRVPLSTAVDAYARGGAGWYSLSLYESFWGYGDDVDDDDGFGGFLALGVDIRLGETPLLLRIEDMIHFVDLEPFPDFYPGEDEIEGPIHQILVGLGLRF